MASSSLASVAEYTFVRRLNSGSFGDVYLGLDKNGSEVAIKVLVGGESGDHEAIERELYFAKRLRHPHIVRNFDIMSVGQDHWFITEYCPNGDLFGAILPMEGVGDEPRIKKYFSQLVSAVDYLHSLNVVHRDIKPENCLLTADDDLKLCDFGLSGFESDEREEGIGTYPYMAPEVYEVRSSAYAHSHKAADIWSLAVTLYTMLVGMLPWDLPILHDADYETFRENCGRFDNARWSEDLHELLAGMLHWDPSKRFDIIAVRELVDSCMDVQWIVSSALETRRPQAISRLSSELRRPRTPDGLYSDMVVFGTPDGFGSSSETYDLSDADYEGGTTPTLPPPRRTRYKSGMFDIEFNPYLPSDEVVVVRTRHSSETSSSDDGEHAHYTIDDGEDDVDDNDKSWFNAREMSFKHLPTFEPFENTASTTVSSTPVTKGRPIFMFGDAFSANDDEEEDDLDNESSEKATSVITAAKRDSGLGDSLANDMHKLSVYEGVELSVDHVSSTAATSDTDEVDNISDESSPLPCIPSVIRTGPCRTSSCPGSVFSMASNVS